MEQELDFRRLPSSYKRCFLTQCFRNLYNDTRRRDGIHGYYLKCR